MFDYWTNWTTINQLGLIEFDWFLVWFCWIDNIRVYWSGASNWELVKGCLLDHLRYVCIVYEKTKGVTQLPWEIHWENKNIQVKQVKDHVSFRGMSMMYRPTSGSTVDQYIGCYVSRYSVDSQPRCQPRVDTPSIDQHLSWESFSCRSSVGQQIASVACRQCIGESLVKYWWGIGGV